MIRPYIIVFNDELGTRDVVQQVIDKIAEVPYWYSAIPQAVFFTSTLSTQELAKRIEAAIPRATRARWIVVPIDTKDAQGRLTEAGWHLINNPETPRLPRKKPAASPKLTPPRSR